MSNPSSVPHLSPILSQQPSVVPITSNAGSVANIASHNIRLSADKNEAARKSEISSNILPPINTNRSNSIDGKSPTQTSATTNSTTTEKSPITLPSIPKSLHQQIMIMMIIIIITIIILKAFYFHNFSFTQGRKI